ncbi:MAG: nucleotide exchange factor GrpE [Oscillospiraceae bacterium]|jgi:molecular chaperone GrpE|nr:nucleotide exchange factor GrpE [Oscillospiraceae bacterium]
MKDKTKPDLPEEELPQEEAPALDPVVEELKSAKDQLLRLAAEFDNFKKRSQREREDAYLNAKAAVLKAFLPVLDNFERAMLESAEGDCPPQAYRKGVEMILAQFAGAFEAQGASSYGEAGEPFDPTVHSAVTHTENPGLGENVIAEVYTRGYRMKDRIIREAVVGVAN